MSDKICVVCKTPIDSALVVDTDQGPVHPGACYNYVQSLPVTENTEEQLNETQLLIQLVLLTIFWFCPFLLVGAFLFRNLRLRLRPYPQARRVYRQEHHEH